MIAEPTLEHYIYYLRRVEGDNAHAVQQRRTAFEKELRSLMAHLARLSGQTLPDWEWPPENDERGVSQQIAFLDWLDDEATGRSCFAQARIYGDVYWLQVGYCQAGQAGSEIFASLRAGAWSPSFGDHLLGSSTYLCGIVPDQAMDKAAVQVLQSQADSAILSTHLTDCCARLYGSRAQPYITALLYPDKECEDWAGRTILNNVAPRLELYRHKADRQLAWCEGHYAILSEQEQTLRALLSDAEGTSRAERELLEQLVRLHPVFSGNVGTLADRGTTIDVNLDNLDVVLKDLGPLVEDRLLGARRDDLRHRQKKLATVLRYANQPRQRAGEIVTTLTAKLGLGCLLDLETAASDAVSIERAGWLGAQPPAEAEMEALTPHQKPTQAVTYPQIHVPPHISLTSQDKTLLQRIYQGFSQVLVEKEFGGGYGGARVLLTNPVTADGVPAAKRVTKLGPALELHREYDNYAQFVGGFLPFSAAQVERERYREQDGHAGLSYIFVGGEALGQAVDLEEYYHQAAASGAIEPLIQTLDALLDKALGQRWYGLTVPRHCFFSAEYGRHLVEHVRLQLRPASSDRLWLADRPPSGVPDYQSIDVDAISREHETLQPGTLLSVEGMVVRRLKREEIKLEDPDGQGTIVRVAFAPGSKAGQGLKIGDPVGVRGQVIYNRPGRMEQIVRDAYPNLSAEIRSDAIKLAGLPDAYPNPLKIYPKVLGEILAGMQSYVHGDLHLRNVLVDEGGRGWLIDFARVEKRHNLFDFIKLETYVRLMGLAGEGSTFSLDEYVRFEQTLNDATLGSSATPPSNPHLKAAFQLILAMRRIARKYMGQASGFGAEYFPALFLYCLAVTKYYQKDIPQPTRLAFATACVLGRYIFRAELAQARPAPSVTQRAQKIPESTYNTAAIRQLLTAAFDDEGLTRFCHDHFREAFEEFSTGMSKGQKVHRLLDYCERHCLLEELLGLVEQYNPTQYAHWENRLTNEH